MTGPIGPREVAAVLVAITLLAPRLAFATSREAMGILLIVLAVGALVSLAWLTLVIIAAVYLAKGERKRGLGIALLIFSGLGLLAALAMLYSAPLKATIPALVQAGGVTLAVLHIRRPR